MFITFVQGFALSITLILAIGAQNAFVLRQGLREAHVFWICLICGVIDAVLIVAGIAGFGALAQAVPWFETAMLQRTTSKHFHQRSLRWSRCHY